MLSVVKEVGLLRVSLLRDALSGQGGWSSRGCYAGSLRASRRSDTLRRTLRIKSHPPFKTIVQTLSKRKGFLFLISLKLI